MVKTSKKMASIDTFAIMDPALHKFSKIAPDLSVQVVPTGFKDKSNTLLSPPGNPRNQVLL